MNFFFSACRLLFCILCLLGGLLLLGVVAGLIYYFCFYEPKSDETKRIAKDINKDDYDSRKFENHIKF